MARFWPPWRRAADETESEGRAITFQDVWGSGADVSVLSNVNADRALTLSPVYAATSLIADLVSACPLHGYRKVGATRTELEPQPSLVTEPSIYGSPFDWVHRAVTSLALRGNAYGLITDRDPRGYPRQIEWLHPDFVSIDDNFVEGPPTWRYHGNWIDASSLVHIPYYTVPGQVLGLSPIRAYALSVDVGLFAQAFGRDYFRNGSVPTGILKTDQRIDDEARADVIKARFKRDSARREPVVLGSGLEYKPISVPPDESQFLATIQATAVQIAAIYHLRPELIGGDSGGRSLTYANVEQQAIEITRMALMPYIRRIEAAVFKLLPGQQYIRFNIDSFMRADLKTRYEAHSLALTDGWMSKDEVRDIEDLSPMPRGLGGFPKPVAPAAPAALPGAASGVGPTGDGNPANGSSTNGTGTNGSGPTNGAKPTTNGTPAPAAGSNGRALLSPWDHVIGLHGRRSDPWL